MKTNWRQIYAARNSYATLAAACELSGFSLHLANRPEAEVTCYSLNSLNEVYYRDEIANADCITIVGGPHATACFREVSQYADFVITGEGEYTLPRLLEEIERGNSGNIPGVTTRNFSNRSASLVRLDAYPAFFEKQGFVECSRGCPFACGYCQTPQIFGHCIRHRSIDAIAEFSNRYKHARFVSTNAFAYGSDGIHPRWDKIEALFKKLHNQIFFGTFPSEVRPEFICKESLSLVNQYCTNTKLHFGAQSGSDAMLKRLHRGHSVDDVLRAIDLCRDFGITPVVDFIVGFPTETDEEQLATVDLIRQVACSGKCHVHQFIPLPGTPLAGTTARPLLKKTEKICGKLALAGKITGSWSEPEIRFFRPPSNNIS